MNSESRGRLRHLTSTDWPWKIDHIPVPSRSLRRIIFRVFHCGGRLPVKFPSRSHIRELRTRGITAK